MAKNITTINVNDIPNDKSQMHPLSLFLYIAKAMNIQEVQTNTDYDSLVYTFYIFKTEATKEFCDAINFVRKTTKEQGNGVKCRNSIMEISYIYSKKKNECLSFKSYYLEYTYPNEDGLFYPKELENYLPIGYEQRPDMEIHVYDNGKCWNYSVKSRYSPCKGFPCSMKDFFYYQYKSNVEQVVFYHLFKAWGEVYPIWRDLADDFNEGCIYSSIPLELIFASHNKRELIQTRYGVSWKRNNKENIGNGIFYARASRLVKEEELQKLFGFKMYPCFIGRKKTDMVSPLSYFIYTSLQNNFPDMTLRSSGRKFQIDQYLLKDAIRMSIALKKKIPLTFYSLSGVKQWHDNLAIEQRNRTLERVVIPKQSRFRKLKMPENCVRLTNRKMFAEEGCFPNNCVTSYIYDVNQDDCSIWSMRKSDGTRSTIEIRIRRSKNEPNGYFYIRQMYGFDNMDVPDEDWELVRKCIQAQTPCS